MWQVFKVCNQTPQKKKKNYSLRYLRFKRDFFTLEKSQGKKITSYKKRKIINYSHNFSQKPSKHVITRIKTIFFPKKCANASAVTTAYSSFDFSLKYCRIMVTLVDTNLHYGQLATYST